MPRKMERSVFSGTLLICESMNVLLDVFSQWQAAVYPVEVVFP